MTGAEDLQARVRGVIADVCRRATSVLGPEDDLVERLDLDSLEGLHILAALEKRFAVRFPDDRLGELRTIRAIVEAIRAVREGADR